MKNLKRSKAMKESWARRKAEKGENPTSSDVVIIPVPIFPVTDVVDKGTGFWVFLVIGLISFIVGALFF